MGREGDRRIVVIFCTVIVNTDQESIVTFYSAIKNNNYYEAITITITITKSHTTHT